MNEGCNPHECPVGQRLEHQLEEFKKANSETHQKLWEAINELKTNDAVQDSKYETIITKLNEVTMEVKALQAVPGNNWKEIIKTIITTVGSIIVGFVLAKLGIF